jgi:hypothetical protein
MDCSEESPIGRRHCVYDKEAEQSLRAEGYTETWNSNAVSMAALMGVNLLSKGEYIELQTKGRFDKVTWVWLNSPDKRRLGKVLYATSRFQVVDGIDVVEDTPNFHFQDKGFRASLRV